MYQMRNAVECPYCGKRIDLGERVGTWVETCRLEPVYESPLGTQYVQVSGCGKSFVVFSRRRIAYRATVRKIEGE
ncbi:hypothetical protein [Burkholderia sp.]|uniref:hypothetical protein n=1 Tax=Burkholderia sp. TaxID=36773 RepID=UPI0025B8E62E|nr:hypothetical protein [Burkholderia sp.]MBS6361480.1 hypothetical protein [Burkholderia sp.]